MATDLQEHALPGHRVAYEIHRGLRELAFLPFLTWRLLRVLFRQEAATAAVQRLGLTTVPRSSGPLIWFHAATLGDCTIAMPVMHRMVLEYNEKVRVLLTVASAELVPILSASIPHRVILQLAPADYPQAVALFLAHWQPSAGVMVDTDVSPILAVMARESGVPLALLDAHLPRATFFRWHSSRFARAVYGHFVQSYALIVPQSDVDVGRFRMLGAHLDQMPGWCSDLHCASKLTASVWHLWRPRVKPVKAARAAIGSRPAWIASDVSEEEEKIVEYVHHNMKNEFPTGLTFVVPRAMHRCPHIAELFAGNGARVSLWSRTPHDYAGTDVFVVDAHGQLPLLYAVCEVVFVGGTLVDDALPGSIAHAAVAACAVLCGTKSPESVRLAEELNTAANVTAEESANAVYTAGVHTDDLSPLAGTQPSTAAHHTARFEESFRLDGDDTHVIHEDEVIGLGLAALETVSLRTYLPAAVTQPHSAPAALAEGGGNPFARSGTLVPPASGRALQTLQGARLGSGSARNQQLPRQASLARPASLAAAAAAGRTLTRRGSGTPMSTTHSTRPPPLARPDALADSDAPHDSSVTFLDQTAARRASEESDMWTNAFSLGPGMSTELSNNSMPESPVFTRNRTALHGTPTDGRGSESSFTTAWPDCELQTRLSARRSFSPTRAPAPWPRSPSADRCLSAASPLSASGRGSPHAHSASLPHARSLGLRTRTESLSSPRGNTRSLSINEATTSGAAAVGAPLDRNASGRSDTTARPRGSAASVPHQVLPPHQMVRFEVEGSPMFGGGPPLSPSFLAHHSRSHGRGVQDGSSSTCSEACLAGARSLSSNDGSRQRDGGEGAPPTCSWPDETGQGLWSAMDARDDGAQSPLAGNDTLMMGRLPPLRPGMRESESLSVSMSGAPPGDAATSTRPSSDDTLVDACGASPVAAPFGLRQIVTGTSSDDVGPPERLPPPPAWEDAAQGGGDPAAWAPPGGAPAGLRVRSLEAPAPKDVVAVTSLLEDAVRRQDGRLDTSTTSPVNVSSDLSDCWAGTSPYDRGPAPQMFSHASLDTCSSFGADAAEQSRDFRLPRVRIASLQAEPDRRPPAPLLQAAPQETLPARASTGGEQRVDISYTALRHTGEYVLSASNLPYHPHGPAVWLVSSQRALLDALLTLLRESIERRSRGHAAAQGAARLATNLVSTVWDVVDGGAIEPALLAYEASTKDAPAALP